VTVWPYIQTNKRIFHSYFYNPSTTFYVWLDNWGQVKDGPRGAGDRLQYPNLPPEKLPSAAKYWHTHSVGKIVGRLGGGLSLILRSCYTGFGYFKYALFYLVAVGFLCLRYRKQWDHWLDQDGRRWTAAFVAAYLLAYLFLVAFYAAIAAPNRFVLATSCRRCSRLSYILSVGPFTKMRVSLGRVSLSVAQFFMAIEFLFWIDLVFFLFNNLMLKTRS